MAKNSDFSDDELKMYGVRHQLLPTEASDTGYKLHILAQTVQHFLLEVGPDRDFVVKTENNGKFDVIVVETI